MFSKSEAILGLDQVPLRSSSPRWIRNALDDTRSWTCASLGARHGHGTRVADASVIAVIGPVLLRPSNSRLRAVSAWSH
jgi:hypothetical protein